MRQPSITDYIRTLENPYGVFRTLGEVGVDRNIYREVELRAGNSAAVFTYMRGLKKRFFKCYIRRNPHLRAIYRYIEQVRSPLLPEARLLRDELYVHTLSGGEGWTDIVEGEWTDGETLDTAIARSAKSGNTEALSDLAETFDALCRELLAQEWAHGDLKPENIVVRPDGGMTLIDCDAMWTPGLAGQQACELGTPAYRHPSRDAGHFDKRIDDYPMMLISASLHALALDPSLFPKYNTTDNIIFSPAELVGGGSPAFTEVSDLFALRGMARQLRMLGACCSPFPDAVAADEFFTSERACNKTAGRPVSFVRNGKWGFADEAGHVRIAPFWDEALDFRDGCAAVRLGQWWHTIDTGGNIVRAGLREEEMAAERRKTVRKVVFLEFKTGNLYSR